jgi:hypothetical protein
LKTCSPHLQSVLNPKFSSVLYRAVTAGSDGECCHHRRNRNPSLALPHCSAEPESSPPSATISRTLSPWALHCPRTYSSNSLDFTGSHTDANS